MRERVRRERCDREEREERRGEKGSRKERKPTDFGDLAQMKCRKWKIKGRKWVYNQFNTRIVKNIKLKIKNPHLTSELSQTNKY